MIDVKINLLIHLWNLSDLTNTQNEYHCIANNSIGYTEGWTVQVSNVWNSGLINIVKDNGFTKGLKK